MVPQYLTITQEKKTRQISIHATPLHLEWMDKKFNMIDTPGYSDFIGEATGSLNVVDLAVITIHAVNGVEVGTETMWNQATKLGIPKMLVINGLDREHTKFDEILDQEAYPGLEINSNNFLYNIRSKFLNKLSTINSSPLNNVLSTFFSEKKK